MSQAGQPGRRQSGNVRTDEQLVAAAQSGEAQAIDELLRRHYDRVHSVCRRIAGSNRDADDAAQEAMIRVVKHLNDFDGRSRVGTWIYRIATNAALDELRGRKRRPQLQSPNPDPGHPEPEQADRSASSAFGGVDDRLSIEEALSALSEDFRVPVVMRDIGDLDYAEIAIALDVPIGTVKSRIARGRRALLEHLGNQDSPPERQMNTPPPGSPED